jgi:threonine dehydratase
VVSGGNLDAGVLASLLSEGRPRPPRKPRRRSRERLPLPAAKPSPLPAGLLPSPAADALRAPPPTRSTRIASHEEALA